MNKFDVVDFLMGRLSADDFEAMYPPEWGPIGREVFERTYSRKKQDGSKELWCETVRRVVSGSLGYVGVDASKIAPWRPIGPWPEAVQLFVSIYQMNVLPAGRHLWVTGTGTAFSRNCWSAGFGRFNVSDHVRFFASRLFEGGGVGVNYSSDLVPVVDVKETRVMFSCRDDHPDISLVKEAAGGSFVEELPPEGVVNTRVVVDDTREGWVEAYCQLLDRSECGGVVLFDVSDLRPFGAELRTFGGTASGPAPLITALKEISAVVCGAAGRPLSGLEWMSIDHHVAVSVISGGSRRSARMSMMHWGDPAIRDFINCKRDGGAHWSTNISVEVDEEFWDSVRAGSDQASVILRLVAEGMLRNGEPGIADTGLGRLGEATPSAVRVTNPCGEIMLETDPDNGSGEPCCLGSVDLSRVGTDDALAERSFREMTRFLMRATFAPQGDETARTIEARNRRIGVGFMGLQGWCAAHGVKLSELPTNEVLKRKLNEFYRVVRSEADVYSSELGAPSPIKVTAIAPTGSISALSGATPGIGFTFARHYVRRVRFSNADPALSALYEKHVVEPSVYEPDTSIIEFLCEDPLVAKYGSELIEQADEVTPEQYWAVAATVQEYFVDNAVSGTAEVDPAVVTVEDLMGAMVEFSGVAKGFTAFPPTSMAQAPLERLSEAEFLERSKVYDVDDYTPMVVEDLMCDGGACPIR